VGEGDDEGEEEEPQRLDHQLPVDSGAAGAAAVAEAAGEGVDEEPQRLDHQLPEDGVAAAAAAAAAGAAGGCECEGRGGRASGDATVTLLGDSILTVWLEEPKMEDHQEEDSLLAASVAVFSAFTFPLTVG
jgi:hypothetical protein